MGDRSPRLRSLNLKYQEYRYHTEVAVLDKDTVLKLLESERERAEGEKLEEYNVVIESKKLKGDYGAIKGLIYKRKNDSWSLLFRGAVVMSIEPEAPAWKGLAEEESKYIGISFDLESKTLSETIKDFFVRSMKEGKIQDFLRL